MRSVKTQEGVFIKDGKPQILATADYPYYRDNRDDWSGQLDNLKKMGIEVVTCYIPWRHHSVRRNEFDFTGKRRPNTDVLHFLKLIQDKGMSVIVKPGPLIHAETNFGGLPDYVSAVPDHGIEPLQSSSGDALTWGKPLPAYLGKNFLERLDEWLGAVSEDVIKGRQYPKGPIVGIQILNEGFYTNSGAKVTGYDYSSSGIEFFREFLKQKYKTIAKLNDAYKTDIKAFEEVYAPREFRAKALGHLHLYLDWAEYAAFLFAGVIEKYLGLLGSSIKGLPVFINLNLCDDKKGAEIYPVRNNPHALKDLVCWGFTDWAGPIAENEEPARKYRIVTGLARGVCMEENWGFSKLYNPLYRFVQPSFYQTMYYMALGATGYNIYTGVSTKSWDDHLDSNHKPPYPENAPVAEDGSFRDQFYTVHQMNTYMKYEGGSLVASSRSAEVAWALYSPYARAACWAQQKEKWLELGLTDEPKSIYDGMDTFQRMMAYNTIGTGAVFIQEAPITELKKYRVLCIAGGDWMDSKTLEKLVDYVKSGGTLIWSGAVPNMDEYWKDNSKAAAVLFPVQTTIKKQEGTCLVSFENDEFTAISEHPVYCFEETVLVKPQAVVESDGQKLNCAYVNKIGSGQVVYVGFNPWDLDKWERNADFLLYAMQKYCKMRVGGHVSKQNRGEIEVYEHRNDAEDKQYIYVFNRNRNSKCYAVSFKNSAGGDEVFEITLTGYSMALVGFAKGELSSALIKGVNDEKGIYTSPMASYKDKVLKTDMPGDLMYVIDGDKLIVSFVGPKMPVNISIPIAGDIKEVLEIKESKLTKLPSFRSEKGHISFSLL